MLIQLAEGALPWSRSQKKMEPDAIVLDLKIETLEEILCDKLPSNLLI